MSTAAGPARPGGEAGPARDQDRLENGDDDVQHDPSQALPGATAPPAELFAPQSSRSTIEITTIYATSWQASPTALPRATPPSQRYTLGRLTPFYDLARDQLPQVLTQRQLDTDALAFQRWSGPVHEAWLTVLLLPSQQVVLTVTLDVSADTTSVITLLEDLYYADLTIADTPLPEHTTATCGDHILTEAPGPVLLPERHQVLLLGAPTDPALLPTADEVQRLIYRVDLPARPEHSSICHPDELNRRPTSLGALGPYVSVLVGQQRYIEHAAILSVAHIVGAAARLRDIRRRAYQDVERFRESTGTDLPLHERRLALEQIADALGELELDLSFSVEAPTDLGVTVPSLRVESFHNALHQSINLTGRAQTTDRMLQRLRNAIDAELTSIQSVEDRAADARRLRTAFAVTFVTTVVGTFGLLFAFFGINATEVDESRSIFDPAYAGIYLLMATVILVAIASYLAMRWHQARPTRQQQRPRQHTRT